MARAKVTLRKCESFTGVAGEAWRKNQTRVVTDPKKIAYYKAHNEFVVTDLKDATPKRAKPPATPATGGDDGGGDSSPEALTEATLSRMNKADLVDLGAEKFGLQLDEDEMKKDDLVAAILEAQG